MNSPFLKRLRGTLNCVPLWLLCGALGCSSGSTTEELTEQVEQLGGRLVVDARPADSQQPAPPAAIAIQANRPATVATEHVATTPSGTPDSAESIAVASPANDSQQTSEPAFHVHLDGTTVCDDDLAKLPGLENIISLTVSGTNVTDRGLLNLTDATSLRTLDLRRTKVTDEGIMHLQNLPNLRYIALEGSGVTPEGYQRLRNALPNDIAITFDRGWWK